MEVIYRRRSIRKFQNCPVSHEELEQILRAGMAGPTSENNQEWVFVIVNDPSSREKIMKTNPYAGSLKTAPLCIVVCADMRKVGEPDQLYWVQGMSAAAENMLLEATNLGLGSLWMGPSPEQRAELHNILSLPEYIEPLMMLAFGKAAQTKAPIDRYRKECIHFEHYEEKR